MSRNRSSNRTLQNNDTYAERNLGAHSFKLQIGTEDDIAITPLDGTPSIQSRLADGREITIGLERTKL